MLSYYLRHRLASVQQKEKVCKIHRLGKDTHCSCFIESKDLIIDKLILEVRVQSL